VGKARLPPRGRGEIGHKLREDQEERKLRLKASVRCVEQGGDRVIKKPMRGANKGKVSARSGKTFLEGKKSRRGMTEVK